MSESAPSRTTGLRAVVLGTAAGEPYAGMAWMTMQFAAGLRALGHDVTYVEAASTWPYDPIQGSRTDDCSYALAYLAKMTEGFGLGAQWAYRSSGRDAQWSGPRSASVKELLRTADVLFNVTGATDLGYEGIETPFPVLLGTDPVIYEAGYENGDAACMALVDGHARSVTYGENIGSDQCPVPPLPNQVATTRQPILLDEWSSDRPIGTVYTTVTNWKQEGRDVVLGGETYYWSKHREFAQFLELPVRASVPVELATNLAPPEEMEKNVTDVVRSLGVIQDDRSRLEAHGWRLHPAQSFTLDPWQYRDYIIESRAEISIARDLNVRLRTGWFSERSACYLAAGRPVVAQDTGFGSVLPTGVGLFAVTCVEEAVEAIKRIESQPAEHSAAAREIAREFFKAETVLSRLMSELGF